MVGLLVSCRLPFIFCDVKESKIYGFFYFVNYAKRCARLIHPEYYSQDGLTESV